MSPHSPSILTTVPVAGSRRCSGARPVNTGVEYEMRAVWVERCTRWRDVSVNCECVARELRAWPRNPKVVALALGYLDVAAPNQPPVSPPPPPASYGRLTVHLPHHAHVHGQDPDAVILDDAAVACEVGLDPDVACVGVERVLHELEDCVAERCHDERGAQAQRHGFGELPYGGGFGRHLRLERERARKVLVQIESGLGADWLELVRLVNV